MAEVSLPRERRTFEYHMSAVMVKLESVFFHLSPGKERRDFETVLAGVAATRSDADLFADENNAPNGEVDLWRLFFTSCVHLAQADREYRRSRTGAAWTYLLDAQYYVGAALYAKSLEVAWPEIRQETAQAAMARNRSKGGIVTNALWKKVEEEAVRLVTLYGRRGQRWNSERKMAAFIRKELELYAREIGIKMSDSRYLQTISDRLKSRASEVAIYLKPRG